LEGTAAGAAAGGLSARHSQAALKTMTMIANKTGIVRFMTSAPRIPLPDPHRINPRSRGARRRVKGNGAVILASPDRRRALASA